MGIKGSNGSRLLFAAKEAEWMNDIVLNKMLTFLGSTGDSILPQVRETLNLNNASQFVEDNESCNFNVENQGTLVNSSTVFQEPFSSKMSVDISHSSPAYRVKDNFRAGESRKSSKNTNTQISWREHCSDVDYRKKSVAKSDADRKDCNKTAVRRIENENRKLRQSNDGSFINWREHCADVVGRPEMELSESVIKGDCLTPVALKGKKVNFAQQKFNRVVEFKNSRRRQSSVVDHKRASRNIDEKSCKKDNSITAQLSSKPVQSQLCSKRKCSSSSELDTSTKHSDIQSEADVLKKAPEKNSYSSVNNKNCKVPKHKEEDTMIEINSEESNPACPMDLVCIQISEHSGDFCQDILIPLASLKHLKRSFCKICAAVPEPDAEDKLIEYSGGCMLALIGYISSGSSNWRKVLSHWKGALELFSAAKTFKIKPLQAICESYFGGPVISTHNAVEIFKFAYHFRVHEVLSMCKIIIKKNCDISITKLENDATDLNASRRCCTISTSTFTEPSAFHLPLEENVQELDGVFHKDLENKITFRSVTGHFQITGVQLKLKPCDKSTRLQIYCDLCNNDEGVRWEEAREKSMDGLIIIRFKRALCVKPNQTAAISVEIEDLQPRLCYSGKESTFRIHSSHGVCIVTPKSNRKISEDGDKTFFIEKVFYIEKLSK